MRGRFLPSIALAVAGCLALGAGQASASHVSCGDTITTNTTLDRNLVCSTSPALTIGADGVKLDLAGHHITISSGLGVLNDGHDGVTVRNGGIGGISGGPIVLRHADENRLADLVAGTGFGGVTLDDSDDNRLVRNSFGAEDGGLLLKNGSDRNVIARNRLYAGIGGGLTSRDSDDNLVDRNFDFSGGELAPGLQISGGSANTTLRRNELQGGGREGLFVGAEATNTLVVRNEVRGFGGNGIQVDSPSTTLTRNTSNDNGGWGILAVPGVTDGGGNTASGNGAGQCLNVVCN